MNEDVAYHIAGFLQPKDFYSYRATCRTTRAIPHSVAWDSMRTCDCIMPVIRSRNASILKWVCTTRDDMLIDADMYDNIARCGSQTACILFYRWVQNTTACAALLQNGRDDVITQLVADGTWRRPYNIPVLVALHPVEKRVSLVKLSGIPLGRLYDVIPTETDLQSLIQYVPPTPSAFTLLTTRPAYLEMALRLWPAEMREHLLGLHDYSWAPGALSGMRDKTPLLQAFHWAYDKLWYYASLQGTSRPLSRIQKLYELGLHPDRPLRDYMQYAKKNYALAMFLVLHGIVVYQDDYLTAQCSASAHALYIEWLNQRMGLLIIIIAIIMMAFVIKLNFRRRVYDKLETLCNHA